MRTPCMHTNTSSDSLTHIIHFIYVWSIYNNRSNTSSCFCLIRAAIQLFLSSPMFIFLYIFLLIAIYTLVAYRTHINKYIQVYKDQKKTIFTNADMYENGFFECDLVFCVDFLCVFLQIYGNYNGTLSAILHAVVLVVVTIEMQFSAHSQKRNTNKCVQNFFSHRDAYAKNNDESSAALKMLEIEEKQTTARRIN